LLPGREEEPGWRVLAIWVVPRVPGSFAALRMMAKAYNGEDKNNDRGGIQGSLHCATDDETVRRSVEMTCFVGRSAASVASVEMRCFLSRLPKRLPPVSPIPDP
jgi:hypothetical protein